jgi:hypothetical protein
MTTNGERPLWLTVRGAPWWVAAAWMAWCAAAGLPAGPLVGVLGPAGTIVVLLAIGWALARHLPEPLESLRRYHVDDDELVQLGPHRMVRRCPWDAVESLTQGRNTLVFRQGRTTLRLPLPPVAREGLWGPVLAHVVPQLAADLWLRLEEEEEVRLTPVLDPTPRGLAWWAWAPGAIACVAGGGLAAFAVGFGLCLVERAAALFLSQRRALVLQRSGATLRTTHGALFVPWTHAEVMRSRHGLLVGVGEGSAGLVGIGLPNFWAAAPVIELRAQLGPEADCTVYFRVRVQGDGLAVVGEIEPAA